MNSWLKMLTNMSSNKLNFETCKKKVFFMQDFLHKVLEGSDWNLWFLYKKNFESECRSMWHPDEVKCIGIKLLTSFCSTHILFDPHLVRPTFWHFWTLDSNLFELWVLAGVRCLRVLVACVCSMLAGARCLRVRQHYQPRKVIKKNCM